MRKNTNPKKVYYFSAKLSRQLAQIQRHPLTIVEAPSGFGKTTAIREFLKNNLSVGAREYWYTCLGEPASMAWKGICELFSNIDKEIAANMIRLEMPTMETLIYIAALFRDLQCEEETYLVIDNYQLVKCDIPRELMSAFSMHGCSKLHMIFITQQLGTRQQFMIYTDDIYTLTSSAFFFDREGTANLFRMEGIRLTDRELDYVYRGTEGWVSAIRLQIINYEENGTFDSSDGIESLVEMAIWNKLTVLEKEFLLSVSVMDSFNVTQAAGILRQEVLPREIENLLKNNDFIRYYPDRSVYMIHSILQDYLRNRFYNHQPKEFQKRIIRLAGESYAALSQYYPAGQFFYRIGDYDAILAMPFSGKYLSNQKESYILEFIAKVAENCPEEILCRYPYTMLSFCPQMYMGGHRDTYDKLCKLIAKAAAAYEALDQKEAWAIRGELAIMQSYREFNNLPNMNEYHKAAWEVLREPSRIVQNGTPFTFGSTSILYMYWSKVGELEQKVQQMDEYLPDYLKLTRGHGTGANTVMRAEVSIMRGEDREAEIQCYKALYDAGSAKQTGICICAEQVLGRIAILRGDVLGFHTAVKNIRDYAGKDSDLYLERMADYSISLLYLAMGIKEQVSKWLYNIESIKSTLYAPAANFAQILYSKLLLMEKRYNELYGISRSVMEEAKRIPYLMTQVFELIFLSVAEHNNSNDRRAQEYMKEALMLALPDKVYLPFAQQEGEIEGLIEAVKGSIADKEGLNALLALCKRQERGASLIRKSLKVEKSPLTAREREVALLARNRLSAREIADSLFISEATVRTILKNIYSKLEIHSKFELHVKEF